MEQRISLVTLGVADLPRAKAFYEQLGWHGQEVQETVFLQAGGSALVLWGRDKLAADCGITDEGTVDGTAVSGTAVGGTGAASTSGAASGFGGVALAHNVRSATEVDNIMAAAERAGGRVTKPANTTFYGGYAGVFADPDGHFWEIAHNPGFQLADDGSLTLPDFSAM
jgi:catechol 2,3-dioxygenase-like lactoylglutathione lyase family enzyme